jgi:hypothetical protein
MKGIIALGIVLCCLSALMFLMFEYSDSIHVDEDLQNCKSSYELDSLDLREDLSEEAMKSLGYDNDLNFDL